MDDLEPSYEKITPDQSDSEEDYGAVAKNKKRAARKTKASAEVVAGLSMHDSDDESREAKPTKPQKKAKVARAKKAAPVQVEAHNMVKA
jgi:hypothetical protein